MARASVARAGSMSRFVRLVSLDLLDVFVCEIKKALSRNLIVDLTGEPSALLHLCKQLK